MEHQEPSLEDHSKSIAQATKELGSAFAGLLLASAKQARSIQWPKRLYKPELLTQAWRPMAKGFTVTRKAALQAIRKIPLHRAKETDPTSEPE